MKLLKPMRPMEDMEDTKLIMEDTEEEDKERETKQSEVIADEDRLSRHRVYLYRVHLLLLSRHRVERLYWALLQLLLAPKLAIKSQLQQSGT